MSVKTAKKDGSGTYNLFQQCTKILKLNFLGMTQSFNPQMLVKLMVQRAPAMGVQRAPHWLFNKHVLLQWQHVASADETYIKLFPCCHSWFDKTQISIPST